VSVEDVQSRVVADRGAAQAGPLLEIGDLRVDFRLGGGTVRAVDGLGYSVAAGQTLAVIGESGSGKTVSARASCGHIAARASRWSSRTRRAR
jgi:oligopeptide transport system ATP-binding protein